MIVSLQLSPETIALMQVISNPDVLRSAKFNALTNASILFANTSKREAPVDTGNLRRNIKYKVESDGEQAEVKADTEYALFQEEGTGIFGKRGQYITPNTAKYLRFQTKAGNIVFAKRVKGVPGKWYMRKGSEEAQRRTSEISSKLYNDIRKALNV